MAWSIVSKGATNTLTADGTSLGLALPASLAANNLLVATLGISNSSGGCPTAVTAPSGWTQALYYRGPSQDLIMSIGVWYKVSTGSESGTQTFSWSGSFTAAGVIVQLSGNATSGIIDGTSTNGSTSSGSAASITTTGADFVWLVGCAWGPGGGTGPSAPTGFTLQSSTAESGNNADAIACASLIQSSFGATGAQTITWTNNGGYEENVMVAFSPAAAASDPFPLLYEFPTMIQRNAVYRR